MSGSWRDAAAPIIARVIAAVGRDDEKALRRALHDAYPFGQRHYWPYKVWCDEVRRQLYGSGPSVTDKRTLDLFA